MKTLLHKIASLTLLLSLTYSSLNSQSLSSGEPPVTQVKNEMILYNVGFGFINGAMGVLINEKKPSLKDILVKGGLQGAAGGYLVHLGKNHIYQHSISGNIKDYWVSKGIFSLGNSIIENASYNRWGYEQLTIDYLFTSVQLDIKKGRVGLGINYFEFISNAIYAINYHDSYQLDMTRSLQYGVFVSHPVNPNSMTGVGGKNNLAGGIKMNVRLEKEEYNHVLTHELIHYYQDNQYQIYSSWINRPLEKWVNTLFGLEKKEASRRVFFYTELLGPIFHDMAAYPLAKGLSDPGDYYSNYFEKEARYYSRHK